jgi:hypothetical protein
MQVIHIELSEFSTTTQATTLLKVVCEDTKEARLLFCFGSVKVATGTTKFA